MNGYLRIRVRFLRNAAFLNYRSNCSLNDSYVLILIWDLKQVELPSMVKPDIKHRPKISDNTLV